MLVVGLTGGIATGKSTVSNLFKSHNIPIIDADLIAREVVSPGTPTLGKIVKYFGEDILLEDGTLNRPNQEGDVLDGLWQFVGKIVVVYCSPEIQLHRLMNRDRSSRTDASSRLNSQKPIAEKLDYADLVIDNSGSIQDLQDQMQSVITKLYNEAGWTWRVSWLFPPWAVISALSTLLWRTLRRQRRLARQKKRRDSGTTSQ
ncbi:P-loop containing nucleoside triphosphate hydrolase [Abortiporus biennis]